MDHRLHGASLTARWLGRVQSTGALEIPTSSEGDDAPPNERPRAALLVGMPVITSSAGLRFWLDLCGVGERGDVCKDAMEEVGESVRRKEAQDSLEDGDQLARGNSPRNPLAYGQAWFEDTLAKMRDLRELGVDGVHVMAPGAGPRRRLQKMVQDGLFGTQVREP